MKTSKIQLQLAIEYKEKSSKLQYQADYLSSLKFLDEAAAIFLQYEQWESYISTLVDRAGVHLKLINTQDAWEDLEAALVISTSKISPKHEILRDVYNGYGDHYCYLDNYRVGLDYYNKALEISEFCQKRDFDHLRIYANIGTCWGYAGQYRKQLENLYNALDFIENFLSPTEQKTLKVQQAFAQLYNNIAWVHGELGDFEQNLEFHKKALALRKIILPKNHPEIAASYSNIGGCYMLINDFEKQLLYFQQALRMYKEVFGDNHYDVGRMYNNLGGTYQSVEDYDRQLYYYRKALNIYLHLFGEQHPFVARCYSNIGYNYINKEEYEKALQNLLKAKQIRTELLGAEHFEMAAIYDKLGECYNGLKEWEKSWECYQQAIYIKEKTVGKQHPILAETYNLLGNHYLQQQDFSKAIQHFQESIDNLSVGNSGNSKNIADFRQHRFSKLFLRVIVKKGKTYYKKYFHDSNDINDLRRGIKTLKIGVQLLDYIRTNFQIEYSKLVISKNANEICEYALQSAFILWKQTGNGEYLEECFYFSEKNRAMVLLEALKDTQAKLTANIPAELLEEEKNIRIALTFVEKKLQQLQSKTKPNQTAIVQLQEQLFNHHQVYEDLLEKYETVYPAYFQLKFNIETSSISAIQKHLKIKNTLIQYFVGEQEIFIFCLQKNSVGLKTVAKPAHFKHLIEQLQHSVVWSDEDIFVDTAIELYKLLIQPIEDQISNCSQLTIIRNDTLHLLPFDLLISPSMLQQRKFNKLPYLICKYEIIYHYSATTWLYCLQKQAQSIILTDNFLGLAPVNFHEAENIGLAMDTSKGKSQILRSSSGQEDLVSLPNTAIEVKEVYNLFHYRKLDAKAFLYNAASKQILFKEAPNYKYLLISTHGFVHNSRSNLSGIYLSKNSNTENIQDENILTISEAYNLDLSADLVVLSSCSSGVGAFQQGEGIMAMNRGFLYAGANNIIFTQFDIPDEASSQLVKLLFEEILAGKSYANALRKAKLTLLKEENNSPQDWAGFSLIGL
ncbi:MAG: CHAT domain-containing tetratricopeptide repeat protein [Chitinophagales bacterium]